MLYTGQQTYDSQSTVTPSLKILPTSGTDPGFVKKKLTIITCIPNHIHMVWRAICIKCKLMLIVHLVNTQTYT